jgi:hypothetical protein
MINLVKEDERRKKEDEFTDFSSKSILNSSHLHFSYPKLTYVISKFILFDDHELFVHRLNLTKVKV